jgi:hydroxysqualene synthase
MPSSLPPSGAPQAVAHAVAHGVNHYENFPVASLLCPARLRPAVAAIYWFARTADDLADEGDAPLAQRLGDLEAYRANLHACYKGAEPAGRWAGVFEALAPQIENYKLPLALLDNLLDAFEQDISYTAAGHWYADHAELLHYCSRSANPVGRLLLHLYGIKDSVALAESDAICSALQLINFWQDLSEDIPQRRYYLPLDLMNLHQVNPVVVLAGKDTPQTINLIAACANEAWANMQKGLKLPTRVQGQLRGLDGWRAGLELRCVIQGGLRILEKIKALNHRTLSTRPKLSKWDVCVVLWRALRM